jgi:hypothetical protein
MTEVWFRNPDNYIRELVEVGVGEIAWDRGLLVKKHIDPVKHAMLYFGDSIPYRVLMIGDQGTAELRRGDTLEKPTAVYPTWCYGEDLTILEEMLDNPVGKDLVACNDKSLPADERPVWGQEHRVVVSDLPSVTTGPGRQMLRVLKELQEDHPEAILHIHGLYGFRTAFGMGFGAADFEPRTAAQKGKVHLPSGKEEKYEQVQAHPHWVTVMGFKPVDLKVPRVRCMFNIKSAMWAGEHYDEIFNFKTKAAGTVIDTLSSDADHKTPVNNRSMTKNGVVVRNGDKFHCNTCSLQNDCKHFRDGSVCTLPDAEPKELAAFFKTRDSDQIIDGLGILMQANARRLERTISQEEMFGEISSEVTKMLGQVFDQGIKLAKLVDPNLRGGTKVQVNVGPGGHASLSSSNPRQLIAQAVRELENQGIPREEITQDMITGLLQGMANPEKTAQAIQGTVIAHKDERAS